MVMPKKGWYIEMVELFEIQRFLPLPYEAAMAPRLKRTQENLQRDGAPQLAWVRLPGESGALLRLHTLTERIRAQGRDLLVVEDGGLRPGVEGTAGFLGAAGDRVRFLGELPSERELRDALERMEYRDTVLYDAGGGDSPAFRLLREALAERYGAEAGRHILSAGDLGPVECGGFGLLTAAGLLPMAVAGVDLGALLYGAVRMMERCREASFDNPAWRYAAARRQLCRSGYSVELLCGWDSALRPLLEWAKRLFAAAEGKERKAIFPVAVDYGQEFSNLGQAVQEGPRLFFETVVRTPSPEDPRLARLWDATMDGTLQAHTAAGTPNIILRPGGPPAELLGGLIYFFQYACGLSAGLLDTDPFARPGVEACAAKVRSLLGPAERGAVPERKERRRAAAIL